MIAIMRNFNTDGLRSIDKILLGGNLIIFAVNIDGYEIRCVFCHWKS